MTTEELEKELKTLKDFPKSCEIENTILEKKLNASRNALRTQRK